SIRSEMRIAVSATLCALVVAVAAQDQVDQNGIPTYFDGLSEQANFALNPKLVRNNDLGRSSFKKNTPGVLEFIEDGKCADVGVQPNFDYGKYAGSWYWSFKTDNPFLGDIQKCIKSELSQDGEGFNVVTTGKTQFDANRQQVGQYRSTAEFADASMSIFFDGVFPANYRVLETDYDSYSCVYSCTTTSGFKSEFGFIFTRNPKDAQYAFAKCGTQFVSKGINFAKFKEADQSCL
ncbi:unnamed protein product, partial [Meganyctiphanes norvegica]